MPNSRPRRDVYDPFMEWGRADPSQPTPEPVVPPGWPADEALPVRGWGDVAMPVDELWAAFTDVERWPTWNPCIRWARVHGGALRESATLVWVFNPIKRWYPYLMPARATIVEVDPLRRVTWEVRAPGLHAFHSYLFDARPGGSRFGSWEIAEGWSYRLLRRFWLAHFEFVRDASIAGAATLPGRGPRLVESGADDPADGGGRPPVVVIPGIDGQPGSVAPIVEQLAANRRVLLVDYSREVTGDLDELAEAIAALLPAECDVVGQSIGSWLATEVAVRRPRHVRRVVLISTFTRVRPWSLRISKVMTRLLPRPLYRSTTPRLMALACGPVGDGAGHPFLAAVADSDQEGVARRTGWQIGRDFSDRLSRIRQPALVLLGARDRFVPRRTREFARIRSIFTGAGQRVVQIDGAGHVLLPSAAIDEAVSEIESFLS
jgi:pimeloyl-ACP methyl ester carboxylesterase